LSIEKFLFTYRNYIPIPFFITAVLLADPRHDLVIFGAFLMTVGEILRLAALSFAGPSIRNKEIITMELVSNGPFAYLRNPVYLGNMFLFTGASILSGAWLPYLLYLVIIFFSIHYALCIRYEEDQLRNVFGRPYESYLSSVPRFFPRLSAFPQRGHKKADIAAAFTAEASTFLTIMIFLTLVTVKWYLIN
jgi:protein-S-isoprenylcysteine O-methyltransferase Ste14